MSVSRRIFVRATQVQLEQWLEWVEEEIATGKVNSGWSAGDTNANKWIDLSLPPMTRREMILNDLSIIDPTTYDAQDLAPIKRTRPRYL